MSNQTDQPAIHPFIASLIRKMDLISDLLVTQDCAPALRGMFAAFRSLKPHDKTSSEGQTLFEGLMKARKARLSMEDTDPLVLQHKLMVFDESFQLGYEGLHDELYDLTWNRGYYNDEMYAKFHDPSKGRKSGK